MIETKLKYNILQTFNNLISQFTDKIIIIIKKNSASINKYNILKFILLITLVTTFLFD